MHKRHFDIGEDSVHWLLFACLSEQLSRPGRILEIGTFDGRFTALLARLFPQAEIVTVDLPDSDLILRSTYGRAEEVEFRRFVADRSRNVAAQNITSLKQNSAFILDDLTHPFDLIWVDGGHRYPEVAWDIAFAHFLCREGGQILVDDVIPAANGPATPYVSHESYEVLEYFTSRTGAKLHLLTKRCKFVHAGVPRSRKYVAMFTRIGGDSSNQSEPIADPATPSSNNEG